MKMDGVMIEKIENCGETGNSIDEVKEVKGKAKEIEHISEAMTLKYNGKLRVGYFNGMVKNQS